MSKRIEKIMHLLENLNPVTGITTQEVASFLNLDRTNVSTDLNELVKKDFLRKDASKRPVKFFLNTRSDLNTKLTLFLKKNPSLFQIIEQAKAAVMYPPDGLNMLIYGETGTGKSMLAELIHTYIVETEVKVSPAPFITFNCADYADNPQLLLGQLFGSKKGAFTGADNDRRGLLEEADGGILFLDEIHRLPLAGQEMLFTFIDKKMYRRLGDVHNRKAKVLIIGATTEDPESYLLKTFRRRFPVTLAVPSLSERSIEERLSLLQTFFRKESIRVQQPIYISVNTMKALLCYNCAGNIGQLKTDVKLICAIAYSKYRTKQHKKIVISSVHLPQRIKEGLYSELDHRLLLSKFLTIKNRFIVFTENTENIFLSMKNLQTGIYDIFLDNLSKIQKSRITSSLINQESKKAIELYFSSFYKKENLNFEEIEISCEPILFQLVSEIVTLSEKALNEKFSTALLNGLIIHFTNSLTYTKLGRHLNNPLLNEIKVNYPSEFKVAQKGIAIIERIYDITFPEEEIGFLALFLVQDKLLNLANNVNTRVIVLAHGSSTAHSMVEITNKLLNTNYAIGFDMDYNDTPQGLLNVLEKYLSESPSKSPVLLLVDMGAFVNFGEELKRKLDIQVEVWPLVSTMHVIEATRLALLGNSLEEIMKGIKALKE